jgi:hypothetical protein
LVSSPAHRDYGTLKEAAGWRVHLKIGGDL